MSHKQPLDRAPTEAQYDTALSAVPGSLLWSQSTVGPGPPTTPRSSPCGSTCGSRDGYWTAPTAECSDVSLKEHRSTRHFSRDSHGTVVTKKRLFAQAWQPLDSVFSRTSPHGSLRVPHCTCQSPTVSSHINAINSKKRANTKDTTYATYSRIVIFHIKPRQQISTKRYSSYQTLIETTTWTLWTPRLAPSQQLCHANGEGFLRRGNKGARVADEPTMRIVWRRPCNDSYQTLPKLAGMMRRAYHAYNTGPLPRKCLKQNMARDFETFEKVFTLGSAKVGPIFVWPGQSQFAGRQAALQRTY